MFSGGVTMQYMTVCVSTSPHQAGSQLEALSEEQSDGLLLEACLHTLALVYTSLQAKNPLRRAIARYKAKLSYFLSQPIGLKTFSS